MSQVKVSGNASGTGVFEIAAPNSNNNYTLTLPTATTTLVGTDATQTLTNKTLGSGLVAGASLITSGTAVASTSGTAVSFTGAIPAWVKRITVIFNGVSTSGSSEIIVQLGTGGVYTTSGYVGGAWYHNTAAISAGNQTAGLSICSSVQAVNTLTGHAIFTPVSGNTWIGSASSTGTTNGGGGNTTIAMGGVVDSVRITTVNGTDTFDAGSINILYE